MPESNYDKLKRILDELFMFDQADLDFGIYRIMNVRRAEIRRFLDEDLLPGVRTALGDLAAGDRGAVEKELQAAVDSMRREFGMNDEQISAVEKVKKLREQLTAMPDGAAAEDEVYSHLANFFRRYYKEGDFISQRRYKEGVYAIPYEGEEVKLHWANADQYYIKTSEQFRDYTFQLSDGRRVHFKLTEADTERNNNRAAAGQERRFILAETDSVSVVDGELVIRLEYRPGETGKKQNDYHNETARAVMSAEAAREWVALLSRPSREGPEGPSLLQKHLNSYTSENTFDYFIHKDLGTFLRRELDFYLKNEVMHLDDIDNDKATDATVDGYIAKLRAIRRVAHQVISFVAHLEDFQKKLWLKKKFVVDTSWCVTLDRVDKALYPEIAANERQHEEWVRLFAIDELSGNLPSYSEPLTEAFLDAHQFLPLDTALFSVEFTERLLGGIENLDETADGLLVHSENFQALSLLDRRYRSQMQAAYVDPPYNTAGSEIAYKNDYKHSSWLSLCDSRLELGLALLRDGGIQCVAIDDAELPYLELLLTSILGEARHLATVPVRTKPQGRAVPTGFSPNHDYLVFYGRDASSDVGRLPRNEARALRYRQSDEGGIYTWANFRKTGAGSVPAERPKLFYPVYVKNEEVLVPEFDWNAAEQQWSPRQVPDEAERVVPIDDEGNFRVWTLGWERARMEATTELAAKRDRDGKWQIHRRYRPNQDGALPGTWWDDARYSASEHGTKVLSEMLGDGTFPYPKSIHAVADALRAANLDPDAAVLDYFAGSGTTGHAVINLNREDGGHRKWVLVEMGEYFDTVLKPRVLKAGYSKDWRDSKPVSREGVSQLIKVIRLESYEDTLTNLRLRAPTGGQQTLLNRHDDLRRDYMLNYWVEVETESSPSLLDVEQFNDPWAYTLEIARGSAAETKTTTVDLVETFNYLIGLRVKHVDVVRGVTMVQGTLPSGEKALVIWRKTAEMNAEDLDDFLFKQDVNPRDMEFQVIYVNGDNHLENTRTSEETWKVRLIEDEFKRLMFEGTGR